MRAIAGAIVVCAILAGWVLRYQITPTSSGTAYLLDTWTGDVIVLYGATSRPVSRGPPRSADEFLGK